MNPIVEDLAGGFLLIALAVYFVWWLRTLLAAANSDLDPSEKGLWVLAILVFQFFGPLAWHWVGPGASRPAGRG